MSRLGFADHDRSNWGLALPGIESGVFQRAFEVAGIVPKFLDAFRLLLQDVERCQARGGYRRRVRGRKQKRARAVIEKLDQVARAAHVSAQSADRLGKSSHLNIHAAM